MKKKQDFQFFNAISIFFAHLAHDIYTSFLAPVLPLLIEKLGLTYSMAGFLSVAQRIPSILNPLIGYLSDKVRARYLMIVTPATTAIGMSLIGIAPGYGVLLILLFFVGLSSTLFHIPSPVMMKRVSGKNTGMGMGLYMLGGELARTLGPVIILAAVSWWGFEGVFRLIPFGVAVSVLLFFRLKNIPIHEQVPKTREKSKITKILKQYQAFFILITGITFFRAIIKGAITVFLPTFLSLKGESLWFSGIALSVFQLAGAAGALFAGPLADKLGRSRILLIVSIITPFVLLLFVYTEVSWLLFPFLLLSGLFMLATTPVILSMVNDLSSDRPVFMNSIFMFISFAISSLTILLVGFLSDSFGMSFTYEIASFLSLGSIPFAILLFRNRKIYR